MPVSFAANPKSQSLIDESSSYDTHSKFSGLRSRCTMPRSWQYLIVWSRIRIRSRASFSL